MVRIIERTETLSIGLEKLVRIFRQMEQYTRKSEKNGIHRKVLPFSRKHSTGINRSIWILGITENSSQMESAPGRKRKNEYQWVLSKPNDLSLFLRISKIICSLTPFSVDKLVSFANHKINGCLSFMERMDRLRFVDMMNSLWRGN